MTSIIGRISLQPSLVRPGETVRVEVFDINDAPIGRSATYVSINGNQGGLQYLQFPTAGQRRIVVSVRAANGDTDRQIALLDVAGEPLEFRTTQRRNDIAMLGVTQLPTQPYTAVLSLGKLVDTRSPHLLSTTPSVSSQANKSLNKGSLASRLASRGALGQLMTENPQAMVKTETRRLMNTRQKAQPGGTKPKAPAAANRFAVGAVYDLTNVGVAQATDPPMEYEWDFGDGNKITTHTPAVTHDYFAAIDHASGEGRFVVSCVVKHAGITVKRTLTVGSAYAICKNAGTVVPHVTNDLFAHKRYDMFTGTLKVHNVEDMPLVIDRMSVSELIENGDTLALPRPFINLQNPITIAPRSASLISVNVPFVIGAPDNGQLRYDTRSFTVLYAGAAGPLPVRCSAVFDVPVHQWKWRPVPIDPSRERATWPWEKVADALRTIVDPNDLERSAHTTTLDTKTGTLAVTMGLLEKKPFAKETRIKAGKALASVYSPIDRMMEDRRMAGIRRESVPSDMDERNARAIAGSTLHLAPRDLGHGLHALTGPPLPGIIAEGQICDPENLTESDLAAADAGQLVCQLTDEIIEVLMPARWMNARKGDCILSPGGDGLIGGLMLNVNPPQWYSHSGIMTRNYDEITHSTGSKDRIEDHLRGIIDGSDGFEPGPLKFVWPGAVTQTVQSATEGEDFPDPEFDKTYRISSFGRHAVGVTHNDSFKMIPPLVLKPDPLQETPAVRTALHAIATDARNDAGRPGINSKYHYRWFCYTDPQIGLGAPEGPEAGWAVGTRPSVCSSFIWLHAKARGARLETDQAIVTPTDLEASDIAQGAMVRPITPDGLYTYSAEERTAAALWLYDMMYNKAYEVAGWAGVLLTDAADDVANQFLNVFANDDADGEDSEAWRDVVAADAISPDDMIWWDGPSRGGLYGFVEPAIYREPRIESYTVSNWKKVLSRGSIRGRVLNAGVPVPGSIVQVFEGKTTFTAADGSYHLGDVPLGNYTLRASKVIDGVLYAKEDPVQLQVADLTVDIHLQPPADRFRIAQVHFDFWGRDEEWAADDEIKDPGPQYLELELGPDRPVNSVGLDYRWGAEMRVEYTITVRLLVNNTIDVQLQGRLFEGTSEDTDELNGQGELTFQSGVGQTSGATLTITNTVEDDEDAGVLSISVKNVRNDN